MMSSLLNIPSRHCEGDLPEAIPNIVTEIASSQ